MDIAALKSVLEQALSLIESALIQIEALEAVPTPI